MRINVYAEELLSEVERVQKHADTGRTYYGIRIFLASPDVLHSGPGDDDRSAVTFWGPRDRVATLLREAAAEMDGLSWPTPSQWPGRDR